MKNGIAVIGVIVLIVLGNMFGGKNADNEIRKGLKDAEIQMNAKCPMMVDEFTRMDKVTTGEKEITYHYTIINIEDDVIKASAKTIEDDISQKTRTNKATKKLLDYGVIMKYRYKNKDGLQLLAFDIKGN